MTKTVTSSPVSSLVLADVQLVLSASGAFLEPVFSFLTNTGRRRAREFKAQQNSLERLRVLGRTVVRGKKSRGKQLKFKVNAHLLLLKIYDLRTTNVFCFLLDSSIYLFFAYRLLLYLFRL